GVDDDVRPGPTEGRDDRIELIRIHPIYDRAVMPSITMCLGPAISHGTAHLQSGLHFQVSEQRVTQHSGDAKDQKSHSREPRYAEAREGSATMSGSSNNRVWIGTRGTDCMSHNRNASTSCKPNMIGNAASITVPAVAGSP